jgi:hypothetical protein
MAPLSPGYLYLGLLEDPVTLYNLRSHIRTLELLDDPVPTIS